MKICILFLALAVSSSCVGQKTLIGQIYLTGDHFPVSSIYIGLDKKQVIQPDANGIFKIVTAKRKVRVRVIPEEIFHLDTLILTNAATDTVKLFVHYPGDSALASYDIEHGQVQLYCGGGIAVLAKTPSDKIFETKYSVKYHILDCSMPGLSYLNSYNKQVALYLDEKYGEEWRQTVRPDVFAVTR